ncbi:hypothetical protein Pla123a_20190 [Posidoniimonas polymericola]|uniref:Uncharacterized protein n=1 Tax=Posidoniimonas polymericola TaxID=2528002 RepID=A0A5C5YRA1_9BACT|nr:hypothetical protein [Posidoniimonas polymericola]TWT77358.1 hypothetical protein Pla123a_20190 [Posidoniimonas polymericola]
MRVLDTEADAQVPRGVSRRATLWRRAPPGGWVVLALLMLLHGPRGACWAVLEQAWSLIATLLGGDQVVLAVLSQTAPLTLATALIVFLYCSEWITFESMWSVLASAGILIGGASLGAELRGVMQRALPEFAEADQSGEHSGSSDMTLTSLTIRARMHGGRLPAAEAWRVLTDWRYISELGASANWPEQIPRVALLPEGTNWFGVVGQGVNQLLGYLVFYRPRMFFAALLAGGYLGWAWHRRLEWANDRAIDWTNERASRRAA